MELTRLDWKIVDEQCKFCECWSEDSGCYVDCASDNKPVEDCGIFEAHKLDWRRTPER